MESQRHFRFSTVLSALFLLLAGMSTPLVIHAGVSVVNIIPRALSGETNQDSEPNLTVNPVCTANMAASAFTPGAGFCAANRAPIFVSTNGGVNWDMNCIVPSNAFGMTSDITLRFGREGNNLYAGILRQPGDMRLNILRTPTFAGPTVMEVLVDREDPDQPYVTTGTLNGRDYVYVGNNDRGSGTQTATIDQSFDANANPIAQVSFDTARIESRTTAGQDGPPIRVVAHQDGTVYAVFYRLTGSLVSPLTADLVVVRDDNHGRGTQPFTDLEEPAAPAGDGLAGMRVVQERSVPFTRGSQADFGQERFVASNISIAVDPRNSSTVYVAWADRVGDDDYTLHVRRSTDRGLTWSANDLRSITDAINPALAIDSKGKVGFLYQQLTGRNTNTPRWETHFERTKNAFNSVKDLVLARVPADAPAVQFTPYIGDYVHLTTIGTTFYGIFSANNTPDTENFPQGVSYQRNADFTTNTLLDIDNTTAVDVSIDPFFFQVTESLTIDICRRLPWMCEFAPPMRDRTLILECLTRDCRVVDSLPRNCLLKYGGNCPGCSAGALCPPYYHIYLDGVRDAWKVGILDGDGRPVPHTVTQSETGIIVSFRPDKDHFIEGQIGNYNLVFEPTARTKLGQAYKTYTRLEVSDHPRPNAKSRD